LFRLRNFIDWPFAERIVKQELSDAAEDPAVSTLFYVMMAIGATKESNSESEEARIHASSSYFTKALQCGRKVLSSPNAHEPRIIDLQVRFLAHNYRTYLAYFLGAQKSLIALVSCRQRCFISYIN
jgi:hypothetical protein